MTTNFSQPKFVRKGLPIRWVMLKWNSSESGFWSWLDLFSWLLCLSLSLQWCLRDVRLKILKAIMRPSQWAKIRKKVHNRGNSHTEFFLPPNIYCTYYVQHRMESSIYKVISRMSLDLYCETKLKQKISSFRSSLIDDSNLSPQFSVFALMKKKFKHLDFSLLW